MPTEEQTYREFVKTTLKSIDTQVKTTNGRVSKLENWRWFIMGGLGVLSLLVVPIFIYIVEKGI